MHLNRLVKAAGLNCVHGHGICIRATLEYLLQGVPIDVIKMKKVTGPAMHSNFILESTIKS